MVSPPAFSLRSCSPSTSIPRPPFWFKYQRVDSGFEPRIWLSCKILKSPSYSQNQLGSVRPGDRNPEPVRTRSRFMKQALSEMTGRKKCFINSLPIDILMRILSLLSVDELVRWIGVCKLWRKLITSNHFFREHCNLRRNHGMFEFVSMAGGGVWGFGEQLLYLSLDFSCKDLTKASVRHSPFEDCLDDTIKRYLNPKQKSPYMVLGSFDGLLLVMLRGHSFIDGRPRVLLLMCNPFTRSCRLLLTEEKPADIFDCTWTIAYDALAGRYKVLGMPSYIGRSTCFILDLEYKNESLQANSWKQLSMPLPPGYWIACESACANGKIHILAMEGFPARHPYKAIMVSIDVSREEWKVSSTFNSPGGYITEVNGTFQQVKCSDTNRQEFEHWVLVDFDNPRWVMHPRVFVNQCPWSTDKQPPFGRPVVIGQDCTKLIMQFRFRSEVFVYDMTSLRWESIRLDSNQFDILGDKATWRMFFRHIKSVVSFK